MSNFLIKETRVILPIIFPLSVIFLPLHTHTMINKVLYLSAEISGILNTYCITHDRDIQIPLALLIV